MKNDIYDPIRRKLIRATPEEKIRQRVIREMVDALGYPKGLIAVEKEIYRARDGLTCYGRAGHSTLEPMTEPHSQNGIGEEEDRSGKGAAGQNTSSLTERGIIGAPLSLSDPNRRIDLLCYAQGEGGLRPLLLVECKAGKIMHQAEAQALGYNDAIGAPFIALAGSSEIRTFWREKGRIASVPFLPRFEQLMESLNSCLI